MARSPTRLAEPGIPTRVINPDQAEPARSISAMTAVSRRAAVGTADDHRIQEDTMRGKAPLGTRILADTRDWEALTDDQVIAAREKANRTASSRAARIVTGLPDRRARIEEVPIDLPGRRLTLRVHRPKNADRKLPLIVSFHGGGFIAGTAAQNDWLNSHLAARCPAVVVSVEYRLAPRHPLPQPVEDGYDTLVRLVEDAVGAGIDPAAVAVMGESAGGTIAALIALRAREDGPPLRAQVLNYPGTDWTETMADYPSIAENAGNPTLSLSRLRVSRRLSVPPTLDPRSVSPVKFENLAGLPPALVVTAALDPVADHGSRYVERLREDGTDARLTCYPKATHGFLSTPGLVPAARPARREILAFLRGHLRPAPPG
ncbi:alpha/beta hydrolase [Streptosporangium lutulentum]|uniref:Acetyl esterase n=1 Tax=Streptosporangium lutulentum TaxID=1461250 RepID=A0ABT9QDP6_9ACTN|nr:alpha/beta hydrolase [Streptosporangium lutulentum]MDP9844858.1 acetyl esterase [Streptosporangium lutulentum]